MTRVERVLRLLILTDCALPPGAKTLLPEAF
jgi:hypothetical protein